MGKCDGEGMWELSDGSVYTGDLSTHCINTCISRRVDAAVSPEHQKLPVQNTVSVQCGEIQ